ncbi:MAG: hypothetical protein GY842_12245, partial [bacterium]|nr:hypothetical protein [bacterium]
MFRTASVSNPDKATASAADGANTAVYTLDITRPASAQTRNSSVLTSNAPSDITHGTHAFELTAGDTAHSLSIAVDTEGQVSDTNKDVLERLAAVIGGADDSIDATVIESERNAWSTASDTATETITQLHIHARDSGTSADFSLTDTDDSSLLAELGLGSGAGTAANAAYALNAVAAESTENTVRTDSGRLEIQLLETTGDTPVSINVQGGLDPLDAHLTARIGAYNHFANWVDQHSAYLNTAFIDELTNDISQ